MPLEYFRSPRTARSSTIAPAMGDPASSRTVPCQDAGFGWPRTVSTKMIHRHATTACALRLPECFKEVRLSFLVRYSSTRQMSRTSPRSRTRDPWTAPDAQALRRAKAESVRMPFPRASVKTPFSCCRVFVSPSRGCERSGSFSPRFKDQGLQGPGRKSRIALKCHSRVALRQIDC